MLVAPAIAGMIRSRAATTSVMYRIIGTDQKEYGPIDANQLRQWIVERRIHAQSAIKAEGAAQWQPLGAFPEFAPLLAAAPPPVAGVAPAPRDDTISTIIPYRNARALIAYYL